MTIVKREGLGRPLTWQELDGNWDAVSQMAADATQAANSATADAQAANISAGIAQQASSTVTQAISSVSGNPRELWRRSLTEAGLNLVSGSFEEGATLTTSTDTIWYQNGSQAYTYNGTFPVTVSSDSSPSTTGGSTAWTPVSDRLLKNNLASAMGAGFVGFNTTTVAAVLTQLLQRGGYVRYLDQYDGIVGDGIHNDSAGIQAAYLDMAINGGGTLYGSVEKTYYCPDKILISSDVSLDLRWAKLVGNRTTNTNPTFETATLSGNVLVSNIGTPDTPTELVYNSVLMNMRVSNCYLFLNAQKWIKGCRLENIDGYNNRQMINAHWCFYSSYINVLWRGGSVAGLPAMNFTGQNNSIYFERVSLTVDTGWRFTGGTTSVEFNLCTFEGGTLGFDMQDDCNGITWQGGYWEAVQGVLFRFLNAGTCNVKFTGNYVNLVDIVIQGGGLVTSYLFGSWDKSNAVVRIGETESGFTYRGIFALDNNHDYIDVELREDLNNTSGLLASNYHTGPASSFKQMHIIEATGPGDVMAKGITTGSGVIPLQYAGYCGKTATNIVPFCVHRAKSGSSNLTVQIDTKINVSEAAFLMYSLIVVASTGTYRFFGDTYGTQVVRSDPNTTIPTVLTTDGEGYFRFEIGTFPGSTTVYSCTGVIQIKR
ncbi:putative pectate lyase [Phage vB_KsaM-C1]|nr:putative pectate lyase [Phage vB_KsaM-C1]